MKMSEEMAVRLHRMMWSDMQKELGDNPSVDERENYKTRWISKHFPGAMVHHSCFLCEFTQAPYANSHNCKNCPIKWPNDICIGEGADASTNYISSPISEILALPARNVANDYEHVAYSYYKSREYLLSNASGIPASSPIEDHVKAIRKKASEEGYETAKEYLAECSGLSQDELIFDHIKAIQEKAVEDYFKKTPAAKLATMDVDQAFKQYADELKAPIFRQLAAASGLSAGNEFVSAHISFIRDTAKQDGRMERSREIFGELSDISGVSEGDWCLNDHIKAIQAKASKEKVVETLRKTSMQLADKLDGYKNALSKESDLDRNRPVDDHIREIVKNSMEAGAAEERDRIQEKVYEVLLS